MVEGCLLALIPSHCIPSHWLVSHPANSRLPPACALLDCAHPKEFMLDCMCLSPLCTQCSCVVMATAAHWWWWWWRLWWWCGLTMVAYWWLLLVMCLLPCLNHLLTLALAGMALPMLALASLCSLLMA